MRTKTLASLITNDAVNDNLADKVGADTPICLHYADVTYRANFQREKQVGGKATPYLLSQIGALSVFSP